MNPLVAQGSLNRLKASVLWDLFPALNVTSSYLGRDGLRLSLEGNATDYLPTLTGAVTSPSPYMLCSVTINLVKSQPLANAYKAQFESNTLLGDCNVRPDTQAGGLGIYQLLNCTLEGIREMTYGGEDPTFVITARG